MYSNLINHNYRHTYALVVHTTGEIYTSACDVASYPLRTLYKRLDGLRREAGASSIRAELINLNAQTVVVSIG